ncbi:hypothetical protein BDZ94DRAFT_1299603 [Collybia nuda]|uniref:Uncharacterized protein n=1 Tax=Collybia nuda TaxID=64659 RepID=A0A9P5Y423_9AGAR|nr:hypothetical protein BDZ94DRAFT_1299603 [Collybia nuda]
MKSPFFPSSTLTSDHQGTINTQTATLRTPSVPSQTTRSDSSSSGISQGGAVVGHQETPIITTVTSQVPSVPSQSTKSDPPSSGIPPGAIAGGVIGGMAFILLCYAIFVLYSRYKRHSNSKVPRLLEAGLTRSSIFIPSLDYHCSTYGGTVYPFEYDYTHRPMEGKQERLDRIQQEMEDIQRQRDVLRSDLEARIIMNINNDRQGDAPVGDIERLRYQIEQINRRIGELESGRQEESPPNYSISGL